MSKIVICYKCNAKNEYSEIVGFRDECDCGEDLHCCKSCRFYDPGSYNDCKESSADVVKDKERANFCEFFQAKSDLNNLNEEKEKSLSGAEALFLKK